MRVYADSSFIVRLVTKEVESEAVISEYRHLGYPPLFLLSLHKLEIGNAIFQRAFHQRRSISAGERRHVARERDSALARLEHFISRHVLLEVTVDIETAITHAAKLSAAHTERMGTRAIDLLHVACALTLESELFLTADARQARLARAEGLRVATA